MSVEFIAAVNAAIDASSMSADECSRILKGIANHLERREKRKTDVARTRCLLEKHSIAEPFSIFTEEIFKDLHGNVHASRTLMYNDKKLYQHDLCGNQESYSIDWDMYFELVRKLGLKTMSGFVLDVFDAPWSRNNAMLPCESSEERETTNMPDRYSCGCYEKFLRRVVYGYDIVSESPRDDRAMQSFMTVEIKKIENIIAALGKHGFRQPTFTYFYGPSTS